MEKGEPSPIKPSVTLRNSATGNEQNIEITGSGNFVSDLLAGLIKRFGPNANIRDVVQASGVKPGETAKTPPPPTEEPPKP